MVGGELRSLKVKKKQCSIMCDKMAYFATFLTNLDNLLFVDLPPFPSLSLPHMTLIQG